MRRAGGCAALIHPTTARDAVPRAKPARIDRARWSRQCLGCERATSSVRSEASVHVSKARAHVSKAQAREAQVGPAYPRAASDAAHSTRSKAQVRVGQISAAHLPAFPRIAAAWVRAEQGLRWRHAAAYCVNGFAARPERRSPSANAARCPPQRPRRSQCVSPAPPTGPASGPRRARALSRLRRRCSPRPAGASEDSPPARTVRARPHGRAPRPATARSPAARMRAGTVPPQARGQPDGR